MGGIRKPKKKFISPGHPWQKTRLAEELTFVGEYALRNKRELWRHRTLLARFRGIARDVLAMPFDRRGVQETQLLGRLQRLSLLKEHSSLDDVLNLTIRDVLERRLQTQVFRQGLAKSFHHARQLIIHGHIMLDNHRVSSPGMLLKKGQEKALEYSTASPYRSPNHPERPKGDDVEPASAPKATRQSRAEKREEKTR
ncbi:MAG: 30S ribosomal protein S4 [Promethearchaeota archaeon]